MITIHHKKEVAWLPVEIKEVPADVDKPRHYVDKDGVETMLSGNPDYMADSEGTWLKRTYIEKDNHSQVSQLPDSEITRFKDFLLKYKNKDWGKGRIQAWFLEDEMARVLPRTSDWTKIEVDNDKETENYLNKYFELKGK